MSILDKLKDKHGEASPAPTGKMDAELKKKAICMEALRLIITSKTNPSLRTIMEGVNARIPGQPYKRPNWIGTFLGAAEDGVRLWKTDTSVIRSQENVQLLVARLDDEDVAAVLEELGMTEAQFLKAVDGLAE
ncbi:MAG: hypothetical protein HUJ26_19055 [Planctomycetaceae bacterium]|nr:hypothetical protein [Planctomycetaceae bacterium]